MNLYEVFTNNDFYKSSIYYLSSGIANPILELTSANCYSFIEKYFSTGRKKAAFDVNFKADYRAEGKHIHTVMLYMLGYHLREIVENVNNYLRNFVEANIVDSNESSWYDFRYTWFLTCLYHDIASVAEMNFAISVNNKDMDLEYYLKENNVLYNVYKHKSLKFNAPLFTYSEDLVRNYFFYRTDHCKKIDHGIIGGYILFDRLIKNYNKAWINLKRKNLRDNDKFSYNNFEYANLSWRKEHQDHFALIADSIIAHNIWHSDNWPLYINYEIEELVVKPGNKISISDRPLLFFLSLLDTIEPTKFFEDIDPIIVLKSIEMQYNEISQKLCIEVLNPIFNYMQWFDKIKTLKDWLNVEISTMGTIIIIEII